MALPSALARITVSVHRWDDKAALINELDDPPVPLPTPVPAAGLLSVRAGSLASFPIRAVDVGKSFNQCVP